MTKILAGPVRMRRKARFGYFSYSRRRKEIILTVSNKICGQVNGIREKARIGLCLGFVKMNPECHSVFSCLKKLIITGFRQDKSISIK